MSIRSLAAAVALSVVATSAQAQNLVTNGSFELPSVGGSFVTYGVGNGVTGWNITSGSVDLIHNYWQAANGLQSVDMDGNAPAVLSQFLSTNIGSTYNLSFWIAGNPDGAWDKQLNVFWNGAQLGSTVTFVQGSNNHANMGWTQVAFNGLAATSTSTELRFEGLNSNPQHPLGGYIGAALDDVAVVTATPEPATYALMATGLVAIAGIARRRKNA